ncbi:MAG: HAMP domain-containing protein [Deltaproteobacteria bacterium]|nr:MAG: HAMP domain-containing protein [Deltaproteobacteria bacterium]
MRFGIATKVFLGFSAILAMSALVSVFGIVQMHQIGQGLALVSTGYFPLSPLAGSLAAYEKERERSTERLLEERDVKVRRSLLRLDRTEFARIADDFLTRAKTHIASARESASPRDRQALEKIDTRLSLLAARIAEQNQDALGLQALSDQADAAGVSLDHLPAAVDLIARLRTAERRVDHEIKTLLNVIQEQMNIGVEEAERKERDTRIAVIGLSLLALAVGLLLTWLSNRALRPIAGLTEAAQRLGRGAPDVVAVPEGGGDELALLAHEFNAMAQRLAARERELRAQGEALVRSERLAAIGRIAAQITHEILCDAIVREVDRLAVVTEEYLRYARLPKPQLVRADLNEAVRDLLDFVRPELTSAGISLEQRLAQDLPEVLADVGQIRQLLLNLIRNAREAMAGGGAVLVGTRFAEGDVFVEVRDSGPGIPPERLARIFDPFFTTKERGTGLGLALAQEIAQEHSGQLTASSIVGQGTIFTLRLPRAPEERAALVTAAAAEIARTG